MLWGLNRAERLPCYYSWSQSPQAFQLARYCSRDHKREPGLCYQAHLPSPPHRIPPGQHLFDNSKKSTSHCIIKVLLSDYAHLPALIATWVTVECRRGKSKSRLLFRTDLQCRQLLQAQNQIALAPNPVSEERRAEKMCHTVISRDLVDSLRVPWTLSIFLSYSNALINFLWYSQTPIWRCVVYLAVQGCTKMHESQNFKVAVSQSM